MFWRYQAAPALWGSFSARKRAWVCCMERQCQQEFSQQGLLPLVWYMPLIDLLLVLKAMQFITGRTSELQIPAGMRLYSHNQESWFWMGLSQPGRTLKHWSLISCSPLGSTTTVTFSSLLAQERHGEGLCCSYGLCLA